MLRRAALLAAVLTLTVLAGCAQKPAPITAPLTSGAPLSNLGGESRVVTSVFPGTYDFTGPFSNVLQAGPLKLKAPERVKIPSPVDGSDIELGLHLPATDVPVPVLVFASPYFFAEGSKGGNRTVLDETPKSSLFGLISNFVPQGYGFVVVAVRGTAGSSGCNDLMGPDEITDLDAAITWIGQQKWSTGKVAMTGVSYDGSTPWSVASRGNPYLKTIIPISGVPDMYGLMYRNGSAESRGPLLLNALYIEGSYVSGPVDGVPMRVCPEAYKGLALSGVAGVTGEDPTGYWAERNRKPGVEQNYKGSIFSIQGLQDWNVDPSQVVPWVDHLESSGLKTKQLLGQWEHSWPDNIGENGKGLDCPAGNANVKVCNRADWKETLLHWLDSELKGLPVDTGAPVQVADDTGRWRNEANYPPHDATWTTYQLDHGILSEKAGAHASAILYPSATSDFPPSPPPAVDLGVEKAADFVLGPVAQDLLIAGLPKVHITVTPQGPGGYMGAYLYDRDPNGNDRRVGWTTMNLAFADGSRTRTEVVPGKPIEAMMEIQPMDSVIPAGHQLVLRLWVFTDADRLPTVPPGPVALEMGSDVTSVLLLPTVQRAPDVYFSAPSK